MRLYYSGAIEPNDPQRSPNLSLGGYISDSYVPNALLGNMFSSLSNLRLQNQNKSEVRGIFLKNETNAPASGLTIALGAAPVSEFFVYDFAAIEDTGVDQDFIERLNSEYELPYNVSNWTELVPGAAASVLAATLADEETIGIWLRRRVKAGYKYPTDDELYEEWKNTPYDPDKVSVIPSEALTFTIAWT